METRSVNSPFSSQEGKAPVITLERKLTIGGIVTIATILLTTGITWGVFTTQAAQMKTDIGNVSTTVDELQQSRFVDNGRMVRVETLLEQILDEVKETH